MTYYDCININSCGVDAPVLLPVEAENIEMAGLWLRCFNAEYITWSGANSVVCEIKNFDAAQKICWLVLPANNLVFGMVVNAARSCYKKLQQLSSKWTFSCLSGESRLKTIPQTTYEPVELHFRGWEIDQDIESFILDDFNSEYADYEQVGACSSFIQIGQYETEGRFGEEVKVVAVANYNCPTSPSILFELGLKIAAKINAIATIK